LVYGYLVAKAAIEKMAISRSHDEEIVAIAENDSCAIDALQVLLGTTAGKGNLILKDHGKNAYTVFNRSTHQALRFSRKKIYTYTGKAQETFAQLEDAIASGRATDEQKWQHKQLKADDLLAQPVEDVFAITPAEFNPPPYAPLARSVACAECGEMTMATKTVASAGGRDLCQPCAKTALHHQST
jgi:formylmethanofuran dehydrogenase subunit E